MLNEVVKIEDRVLRFEKAKSLLKIDGNDGQALAIDGHNQSYETSAAYHTNADEYFIHPPQGYVPYYHHTQQYSTFHVPQPYNTNTNKNKNLNTNYQMNPMNPIYQMYRRFESSPVSFEGSSDEIPNKMFVGHLNGELVTQRKLLRHFQRHGHITDIELFKNHLDGSLRLDAFAFISYLKAEEVKKAIEEEDGKLWLGRILKCCQALKKRENASGSGSGSDSFDG